MSIKTADSARLLRKRLRRIHKLYDTALAYVLSLDADYVLNHIVENVGQILELDDCYVMFWDDEAAALTLKARWSLPACRFRDRRSEAAPAARRFALQPRRASASAAASGIHEAAAENVGSADPSGEAAAFARIPPVPASAGSPSWIGILERLVVQSAAPMIIPDTSTFPQFPRVCRERGAMPASVVGVPLMFREKVIGTLTAACWTRRDFEPDEVVALSQLAAPAILSIENARLYTSLRERLREKEILLEGNSAMAGVHDMDEILAILAAQMARVMEDAWCGLLLCDGERLRLHAQATWEAGASLEVANRRELERVGDGGRGEAVRGRPLTPDEQPLITKSPTAQVALVAGRTMPLDLEGTVDLGDALVALATRHGRAAGALVPLVHQSRVLGLAVLALRRTGHGFREGDKHVLQALANQAAVAIVNAQLLTEEKRQAQEKALLLEAARIAASSLDLAGGLQDLAELCAGCLEADACHIFLTSDRGHALEQAASYGGKVPAAAQTLELDGAPLCRYVVEECVPRIASGRAIADAGLGERALLEDYGGAPAMVWPLVGRGPCRGVVWVVAPRPFPPSRAQEDLVDGIVRQTAIFVQNVRLFEEVEIRAERMKAISDITEGINATRDLASIFAIAANSTRNIVPVDWTGLAIIERERQIMRIPVMSYADDPTVHPPQTFPLAQSLVLEAASRKHPRLCDELAGVEGWMERALHAAGMRSLLVVPLIVDNQTVATLNLASRKPAAFTLEHVEVLQEMADHLATAIQNASMFEEITRMNQELRKMDAIKSDFLSTVAHELRTPLTIIKGYLFVLLKNRSLEPFVSETLDTIDSQTDHLKELIENLLSLSRLESSMGLLGPNLRDIRLSDVVDECVANFRLAARKKDVTLDARVPKELVLEADRGMLVRVFYNLVGNALKFTSAGSIRIAAVERDDLIECSVSDTGAGIAPEHLDRVFERFYHVDAADRGVPSGTGLGLSIVQSIVESHGGTIRVDSELGIGTTFTFTLARHAPRPEEEAPPSA